jgi:hypothetical protein
MAFAESIRKDDAVRTGCINVTVRWSMLLWAVQQHLGTKTALWLLTFLPCLIWPP